MKRFLGLFILSLFATISFGQEITSSSSSYVTSKHAVFGLDSIKGNALYTIDCKGWGFFADRPGHHKPYRNNSDYYTTICSNDSKKGVSVFFYEFALEKTDILTVYDEKRTRKIGEIAATLAKIEDKEWRDKEAMKFAGENDFPLEADKIRTLTGHSSPGRITSKKGCLTFRFKSDATVVKNGWYGKLSCVDLPVADPCAAFSKLVDSELMCGMARKDDNFRGKNTYESYGTCTMPGWPASGRELIFKFTNQKPSDLKITLKEFNDGQPKRLNLYVLNDCRPDACVDSIVRPAPNMDQMREMVLLKDAPAGDYYIVVDGNRKEAHNWFEVKVECVGGNRPTCPANAHYYEDFESYRLGKAITSEDNVHWSRANNRSAMISNDRASNGKQSLEFNRREGGIQDVDLDLGQKFNGVYRICWDMYIERMHTAFFGLFGGDESDPWGTVSKTFNMNDTQFQGRWFDVELFVDLDKNKYTLFFDNRKFSKSGDYLLILDFLNFYGPPNAHFYIDRLCYAKVGGIPATPAGAGPISRIANDITATPVQIESPKVSTLNDIKVFPNPTSGTTRITLGLAKKENIQLDIFSQTGKLVQSIKLNDQQYIDEEISLNHLSNGLYLLRATGETSVITKKIILQQ